jgi:hypothetical protein
MIATAQKKVPNQIYLTLSFRYSKWLFKDNANQLCRVELGKFGNILALGLNDG